MQCMHEWSSRSARNQQPRRTKLRRARLKLKAVSLEMAAGGWSKLPVMVEVPNAQCPIRIPIISME